MKVSADCIHFHACARCVDVNCYHENMQSKLPCSYCPYYISRQEASYTVTYNTLDSYAQDMVRWMNGTGAEPVPFPMSERIGAILDEALEHKYLSQGKGTE